MTAVIRAADAPRAASSMSSSSTRCSCTGVTSGWIRKTSHSRQLARNCTCKQSLLNRPAFVGCNGTPRYAQISAASAGWALPLKIATSRNDLSCPSIGAWWRTPAEIRDKGYRRSATHQPALPVPALVQVAAQAEVAGVEGLAEDDGLGAEALEVADVLRVGNAAAHHHWDV